MYVGNADQCASRIFSSEIEQGLNPEQFVRWMEQCANMTLANFSALFNIFRCYGRLRFIGGQVDTGEEAGVTGHPTVEGIQMHVESWLALLHDARLLRTDK